MHSVQIFTALVKTAIAPPEINPYVIKITAIKRTLLLTIKTTLLFVSYCPFLTGFP